MRLPTAPVTLRSLTATFRKLLSLAALGLTLPHAKAQVTANEVPAHLPGELSAEEILDGVYAFPPSPAVSLATNTEGLSLSRIGHVPAPGIHPRILLSPEDLPELRRRLKETNVGRALYTTLQERLKAALHDPKEWGGTFYEKLGEGDVEAVQALLKEHKGMPPAIGHYQPFLYAFVLEAFDALITEDSVRGKKAATAIATYAAMIRPGIERTRNSPMWDDSWRSKLSGPVTGTIISDQGLRDGVGGHLLGYAYDFAHGFMTDQQRAVVRGTIAKATSGRLWMGARLPHHFRNWNWIAVGLQQPLLALAIEGEEGYDPRVYRLGTEIARDYLSYGISEAGMSTEAVGYTQFGFVWGAPFIVAATRRGDNLLCHSHHRAMLDWYLHSLEPSGDHWTSHGDGGDTGPSIGTLSMWRYFLPGNQKVNSLWRGLQASSEDDFLGGSFHLIEPMLWADADPGLTGTKSRPKPELEKLGLPLSLFDPQRSSLIARNAWTPEATLVQFECRTDSVGASHEHADRGNFTLAALGRTWAKDNFRSVETRHHNNVLIDGLGQGYWPGPGVWLGLKEQGNILIAACDTKDNYSYFWPKQILSEEPDSYLPFRFPRWESYREEARAFHARYEGLPFERDTRPGVVSFWKEFQQGNPRLWDEDAWPVRLRHNPVQRSFRTLVFSRGKHPYVLVLDDIQKDEKERLYEWLMQTGPNTDTVSLSSSEVILCDATVKRDAKGKPRPAKGERELLVRVLDQGNPSLPRDYTSRPSLRLEEFDRKDTLSPETIKGALSGARSFGSDKRLVIPSRSVAPGFKILLFPRREGDPLPVTTWNADRSQVTIECAGESQSYGFRMDDSGRTIVTPL